MGMGVWEGLITDAGNNKYTYTANRELCLVHHSHKYCNNHLRLCISSSGSRILNLRAQGGRSCTGARAAPAEKFGL